MLLRTFVLRRGGGITERTVLHCDLNNFFASVAMLDNPTIKNCPIAVCGDEKQRHGIVLAKNEAAKKFGIVTAEPLWQARRKCSSLICVPPDEKRYREVSLAVRDIYYRFTDSVEPFGIDECWLDVTGSELLFGSGREIADKIRQAVKREIGVTVSVGVSFNKVFAKLGSDMKKPDAVTEITRENFKEKVWCLPADAILGVGRSTKQQLDSLGIFTVGDIAKAGEEVLSKRLGKAGKKLYRFAAGEDEEEVKTQESEPKSIGRTTTEAEDISSEEQAWPIVLSLAESISGSLRRHGLFCSAVAAHIRTGNLSVREFQEPVSPPTQSSIAMAKKCMELIKRNHGFVSPLRSIGLRAINLKGSGTAYQTNIFSKPETEEKNARIEDRIFEIREKFGKDSLLRAATVPKNKK